MFRINNGILYEDNNKLFAIGQSYYPSFHYAKYPVPPEGDRIGEMKKDLKLMADMGFNHVKIIPQYFHRYQYTCYFLPVFY